MNASQNVATIFDVAYFVFKSLGAQHISQIKLYKLLWFCQGWHYRISGGKPLFHEQFEAWTHGPVPRDLWNHLKGKILLTESDFINLGNVENVSEESKSIVKKVLEYYGHLTPSNLRKLSHQCDPWKNHFGSANQIIPNDEIRTYFCSLS